MFQKILNKIDKFIMKYHKCEKSLEFFSITFHEINGKKILTDISYRCSICGEKTKE